MGQGINAEFKASGIKLACIGEIIFAREHNHCPPGGIGNINGKVKYQSQRRDRSCDPTGPFFEYMVCDRPEIAVLIALLAFVLLLIFSFFM